MRYVKICEVVAVVVRGGSGGDSETYLSHSLHYLHSWCSGAWCAHRWKPPVSVTTAPVRCQWLGRKILSRNLLRGRISKIILKMKTVDLRDWWWNPHVKDNPVLLVLVMLMTSVNFTLLNLVNKMKCPQKSWWIANATLVRETGLSVTTASGCIEALFEAVCVKSISKWSNCPTGTDCVSQSVLIVHIKHRKLKVDSFVSNEIALLKHNSIGFSQ